MVEAINAMPTQRSVARVWNIHVVFEPPTPPASRPAQRPHVEAPSGSSAVVAGTALQTGPRPWSCLSQSFNGCK